MKNKIDRRIIHMTICVVLTLLVVILYVVIMPKVRDMNFYKSAIENYNGNDIAFVIESTEIAGKELVVKGWGLSIGNRADNTPLVLLLDKNDSKNIVAMNTEVVERPDVSKHFDNKYDYDRCGFEARISTDVLEMTDKEYEILYCYDENSKKSRTTFYRSGEYLSYGKLKHNTGSEEQNEKLLALISNMTDNARYLGCCIEEDLYLFQHDGFLYLVAGENAPLNTEGNTWIECYYNTDKGWKYGSITFEGNEIFDDIPEGYRVSKHAIPKENMPYSVMLGIWNGNDWNWQITKGLYIE